MTTHAVEAQAAGYKGTGVKACVADTGLDTTHPDLGSNFVAGYDVFDPSKPTVDVFTLGVAVTETHATHVSGIVLGAVNGIGIHGVAPEAKLYEARVLGTQPDGVTVEGETSQVMAGVQWLADQGCKVINMSLGGADRSQSEEALYNQIRKNGTLIVVASGNDAANHPSFPGRYQSVLTVGAVDKLNKLASFSNTGAQLDLVAPGVDNLSSFPAGQGRDAFLVAGGPTISALSLEFAGATPAAGLTAPLVNCGLAQTAASCGAAPPAGFVALIQRGAVTFKQKVQSAMAAGAGAAIIYNNAANGPGNFNGTLTDPTNNGTPWIPAISLSQTDGEALAAAKPATATVFNIAMAWNFDSGTSMAAPHVSGVGSAGLREEPDASRPTRSRRSSSGRRPTSVSRTTTRLRVGSRERATRRSRRRHRSKQPVDRRRACASGPFVHSEKAPRGGSARGGSPGIGRINGKCRVRNPKYGGISTRWSRCGERCGGATPSRWSWRSLPSS